MEMNIIVPDLLAALQMPGCPLCRLRQDAEADYIRTLLADHVNDGYMLVGFVRSLGWCSYHAWMLHASNVLDWGDGQKAAVIYEPATEAVLRRLSAYLDEREVERDEAARRSANSEAAGWRAWLAKGWRAVRRRLSGEREDPTAADRLLTGLEGSPCALCEAMDDRDRMVLRIAAREVLNPKITDRWRGGGLLCLHHLRGVLEYAPDEETRQWVVEDSQAKLVTLLAHLEGYMEGYGCTDRDRFSEAEWAAISRTIAFFVGEPQDGRATDALRVKQEDDRESYARHLMRVTRR